MKENNRSLPDILRSIYEFENTIKNTFVLLINYQATLYERVIVKKESIDFLDLEFDTLIEKHLSLHKEVLEKIKTNNLLTSSLEQVNKKEEKNE